MTLLMNMTNAKQVQVSTWKKVEEDIDEILVSPGYVILILLIV